MIITQQRLFQTKTATFSTLFFNNKFQCFILEDIGRSVKIPNETRIPAGVYHITLANWGDMNRRYLARFGESVHKGMLMLNDVPNFVGVLIHMGNDPSHTAGCLITGDEASPQKNSVFSSESAYRRIYTPIVDSILRKEVTVIHILDEVPIKEK